MPLDIILVKVALVINKTKHKLEGDGIMNFKQREYRRLILILVIIIIFLIIALILKTTNVENKYKYFDDDLIKIDNNTSTQVQANIINNEELVVLLTSKKNVSGNIKVKMYDSEDKQVFSQKYEYSISKNGGTIKGFKLPNLDDKYAGNILVTINKEKENDNQDLSYITYTLGKVTTENQITKVNLNFNSKNSFKYLTSTVIAYKNKKIVAYGINGKESILANDNFDLEVKLYPNDIEYDDIKVYYAVY